MPSSSAHLGRILTQQPSAHDTQTAPHVHRMNRINLRRRLQNITSKLATFVALPGNAQLCQTGADLGGLTTHTVKAVGNQLVTQAALPSCRFLDEMYKRPGQRAPAGPRQEMSNSLVCKRCAGRVEEVLHAASPLQVVHSEPVQPACAAVPQLCERQDKPTPLQLPCPALKWSYMHCMHGRLAGQSV